MGKDTMLLEFNDGEELEVEILGIFSHNGVEYIALDNTRDQEVYTYRYIDNGDTFTLEDVEEEVYEDVIATLDKLLENL